MTNYEALARAVREAYARFLSGEADPVARQLAPTGRPLEVPSRQSRTFAAGFAAGVRYAEERSSRT